MKKKPALVIFILSVLLSFISENVSFTQSPSCAICGRTHAQIVSIGHAPSCKYYVAPNKSSSGGSSTNTSVNNSTIILQGVNSLLNEINQASTEEEKREAELAAKREAEVKAKRIEEEKVKNQTLSNSYKSLGSSGQKANQTAINKNPVVVNFNCKITSHRGTITIRKANGEKHVLGENEEMDINVGDVISTGDNGSVKIHFAFEKGGKDVYYSRNTNVRIVRGEEGVQIPEVLKGKIRATDVLLDKAKDTFENAEREATSAMNRLRKKFEVRTPTAVTSVRGTDFTVSVNDFAETEVIVLKGSVELKAIGNENSVIIEAGFRGTVSISGSVSQTEKIDTAKIDRWWIEN